MATFPHSQSPRTRPRTSQHLSHSSQHHHQRSQNSQRLRQPLHSPSRSNSEASHSIAVQTFEHARDNLPDGPCKFRDLTSGVDTHVCGCRHFWLQDAAGSERSASSAVRSMQSESQASSSRHGQKGAAWCFCGHHACYHEWTQTYSQQGRHLQHQRYVSQPHATGDTEPSLAEQTTTDDAYRRRQQQELLPPSRRSLPPQSITSQNESHSSGLGLSLPSSRNESSRRSDHSSERTYPLPPRLEFGNDVHLPSTRSPSRATSIATSVDPSAGRRRTSPARDNANRDTRLTRRGPPLDISVLPVDPAPEDAAHSATEVATPSTQNRTPALDNGAPFDASMSSIAGQYSERTDSFGRLFAQVVAEQEAMDAVATTRDQTCSQSRWNTRPSHVPDSTIQAQQQHGSPLDQTAVVIASKPASPDNTLQESQSPKTTINELRSQFSSLKAILSSNSILQQSLHGLSQRVNALETFSFTYINGDEVHERLELFEGRLLDVESKLEELERFWNSPSNLEPSRKHENKEAEQSFPSEVSLDDADSMQEDTPAQLSLDRLNDVERRLQDLENNSLPSTKSPWEVEVILLPWGSELKGLWSTASEASQGSRLAVEGTRAVVSSSVTANNADGRSNYSSDFDMADNGEWHASNARTLLFPRACATGSGLNGKVFERLKSRGFVSTVKLHDNSARHINSVLSAAFQDVCAQMAGENPSVTLASTLLGLRSTHVPLRKVHKSSRLRFLSVHELSTPSLWTAEFLNSSVFMKSPTVGKRRLFITAPAAYMQSEDIRGWTWQKIRELPRCNTDPHPMQPLAKNLMGSRAGSVGQSTSFVGEADALEACWSWDARLDPYVAAASVHASFASAGSKSMSFSSTNGQQHPLSPLDSNPPSLREESPPISHNLVEQNPKSVSRRISPITPTSHFAPSLTDGRRTDRPALAPQLYRSTSLPLAAVEDGLAASSSLSKRQVISFDQSCSPVKRTIPKRRRLSRAPDGDKVDTTVDEGDGKLDALNKDNPVDEANMAIEQAPTHIKFADDGDRMTFDRVARGLTPRRSKTPASPLRLHRSPSASFNASRLQTSPGSGFSASARVTEDTVMINSRRGQTPQVYATPFSGPGLFSHTTVSRAAPHNDYDELGDDDEGEWEGVNDREDEHDTEHSSVGKITIKQENFDSDCNGFPFSEEEGSGDDFDDDEMEDENESEHDHDIDDDDDKEKDNTCSSNSDSDSGDEMEL